MRTNNQCNRYITEINKHHKTNVFCLKYSTPRCSTRKLSLVLCNWNFTSYNNNNKSQTMSKPNEYTHNTTQKQIHVWTRLLWCACVL